MKQVTPPRGWQAFMWRLPIWLYRLRLGWLFGERMLLLHHTGRKSGQLRQAVLEVVKRDGDDYYIAAGFGRKSHWFQNIEANPHNAIEVGRKKLQVHAEILTPEQSSALMVDYAQRHPKAARRLTQILGYTITSDADYATLGRDHIPFVRLRPASTPVST